MKRPYGLTVPLIIIFLVLICVSSQGFAQDSGFPIEHHVIPQEQQIEAGGTATLNLQSRDMDYFHGVYYSDQLAFTVWPPDGWTATSELQRAEDGWYAQTCTKVFHTPGIYTYPVTADDDPGWDNDDPLTKVVTIQVVDTTPPTFTNIVISPTPAKNDGNVVTIMFTSEDLPTNPTVQVNGHSASYLSKSASENVASYTYTYYVRAVDPDGDATITFSGTDRADNAGTGSNTTALDIWALQWNGTPLVDCTGTVRLAWDYAHTFHRLSVEYLNGTAWVPHSLFPVTQANQPDYRLWSMGVGVPVTRSFRVRVFENVMDQTGFIAGDTSSIVPGGSTLPYYPYSDYLSPDQRGLTYSSAY